ncbi:GIY-YIG nuclease family protein [bacterium]|nr:GIY-YIG nuclease family protein [bacterium]
MIVYYVYIMRCTDNSYYVGFTTDLDNRLKGHKSGYGSKHANDHHAEKILYHETFNNKYDALKRESQPFGFAQDTAQTLV